VVTGSWQENCYVVSDAAGNAVIVDPGDDASAITSLIADDRLRPLAILATHAHHDHVGAAAPLQQSYGIPLYLHSADQKLLKRMNFYRRLFEKADPVEIAEVDVLLDEIRELELGEFRIRVLETPGHTPGSVCFAFDDTLFCGDVLLKEKVGRVDLPGGERETLAESLRVLAKLPPQTSLFPGHGEMTTLSTELASNEQLRDLLR
jgi:glyoxylase-like metal-dependent hydrolase (beta-lactamase superfamily II)